MTLEELVRAAIEEDVGTGDRTTLWTVPPGERARARVLAREDLVVAGTGAFAEVFRQVAPSVEFHALLNDGLEVGEGDVVADLEGPARGILTAERTALNFLGRLSGIATLTRAFVRAVEGTETRILDTRKTTPGWRRLEKSAVVSGGGENHRFGLHDMVLIKENHIAIAGGIPKALTRVREENVEGLPVEVEVASLAELEIVRDWGVDRVLLDNMTTEEMSAAVAAVRGWAPQRPLLEASGNMSLTRVAEVARVGVDCISVGALTHSAPVADLSLLMEEADL